MFSDALRQYRAVLPDSPTADAGAASVTAPPPGQTRIAIDVRRIAWIRRLAGDYAFNYSTVAELYAGNPGERDSWTGAIRRARAGARACRDASTDPRPPSRATPSDPGRTKGNRGTRVGEPH